jgi:hypothetical protein
MVQLLNSADDRVRYMAADKLLERGLGKVPEGAPSPVKPDLAAMGIDLRRLTTDELKSLAALLGRAQSRPMAEAPSATIDAQVVDKATDKA